jgi:hypothetical protein
MNVLGSALSGIARATQALDVSAQRIVRASSNPPSDDLAGALIAQDQASVLYKANATVVRTAEDVIGALMSITA